jgi:uncharacterized heparinase superfamily protein
MNEKLLEQITTFLRDLPKAKNRDEARQRAGIILNMVEEAKPMVANEALAAAETMLQGADQLLGGLKQLKGTIRNIFPEAKS